MWANRPRRALAVSLAVGILACAPQAPGGLPGGAAGPAANLQGSPAATRSVDRLVISQVSDAAGLMTINPIERLHTLLPRNFVYDQLLTRQGDQIKPMLAESVEALDPTRYRIVLRKGVKFHNGDVLDAASVKGTIEFLARAPETGLFRRYFVGLKDVLVVDDRTVEVVFEAPNALMPVGLTQVPIFPARQLADNPAQQLADRALVGTGPYKLAEFSANQAVTLTAFDDYWGGRPPFREVVLKHVPEVATRIAELRSGTAHIIGDLSSNKVAEIEQIGGAKVVSEPGIRSAYLMISPLRAPLDVPKVRQAIYHAIDRKSLAEGLFGRFAEASTSPATPKAAGSTPVFPLADFDRDRATSLLREAGVRTPLAIDLDTGPFNLDVAQVLQAQLREVGIELTINLIDNPGSLIDDKRLAGKPTPTMNMVIGLDNIELDAYFTMEFYNSVGRYGYPTWAEFQGAMKQYLGTADPSARADVARRALEPMRTEMPIIWLFHPLRAYGVGAAVELTPRGDGQLHIQDVKPR